MSEDLFHVAMVAPGPFPAPRGSQVLVRELAEALADAGHTVHVVAYGAGDPWHPHERVHVHRTPAFLGGRDLYGPSKRRLLLNLMLLSTLYRVVREEAIDVIHAHNYEAPILGYLVRALTGVPVVYHGHNVMSDELGHYFRTRASKWLARRAGRFLDRSIPRRADHVIALSPQMAVFLHQHGVPADKVTVIPPGVALEPAGCDGESTPDPFPGAKVILYAGNLDPYQDLPLLLDAIDEVRRQEPQALLVVATHASAAWVQKEASRRGVASHVRVFVATDFAAVRRLLHRADVVVCPRTSWFGFPIKLLNYMAAGRAIVVSSAAQNSLRGGPVVVVPEPTAHAFACGIISTLRDPGVRAKLGAEARKLAREAFAWPLLVPEIVNVYRNLVHPGTGTHPALQDCKKMLQKTTVWEFMERWRGVEGTSAGAGIN